MGLSPLELVIVGLLVVLLFGTRRLPELGAGLGKAISNFRRSYKEGAEIDVTPSEKAQQIKSEEKDPTSGTKPV